MIYATEGLVQTVCRLAAESAPESVSISLAVTPAGDLSDADLPLETPVFTHFYMPSAGGSVNAVFGVDLGTPVAQTQGRFVSHPDGTLTLTEADDLHEVVFVAVPPWDADAVATFDRSGVEQPLTLLDAEPPEDVLE